MSRVTVLVLVAALVAAACSGGTQEPSVAAVDPGDVVSTGQSDGVATDAPFVLAPLDGSAPAGQTSEETDDAPPFQLDIQVRPTPGEDGVVAFDESDDTRSGPKLAPRVPSDESENGYPVATARPAQPTATPGPTATPTPEPTATPVASGVIFESDFSADAGYRQTNVGLWNGGSNDPTEPPTGWDGVKATGNSVIEVVEGAGVDGSNALRLAWDPASSQPTISLGKHLTGDAATGHDELYVRYHVRLPNGFKAGDDGDRIFYWKWGRLWQNTSPGIGEPGGAWTENRADSGYVVWNFGGNVPYTDVNAVWSENTGANLADGSAGGERQGVDFFVSGSDQHSAPGYFESLWDLNTTDRPGFLEDNTGQSWHTIEYRFRLASSPTADDGEFEMWWDGVSQGQWTGISAEGGAPERTGIPTARMGSGWNFLVLFDNLAGWNEDWNDAGVDGWIDVNDVVISTERIGHTYEVS